VRVPIDNSSRPPPAADPRSADTTLSPDQVARICEIGELFAHDLAGPVSTLLKTPVQIALAAVDSLRHADLLASLRETDCCWRSTGDEGKSGEPAEPSASETIWWELAPPVAHAMVDCLMGGVGSPPPERPPTSIERRLLGRVVKEAADSFIRACADRAPPALRLTDDRPDLSPETISEDTQATVLVASFTIALTGTEGTMRVCLPASLVGLIAGGGAGDENVRGEEAREDASGESVELSAAAPEAPVPSEELADLAPGDVLVTDVDADVELTVRVDGREEFGARLGSRNGKRAVTITRRIEQENADARE
jgi:flagellar motor switch protein FliM